METESQEPPTPPSSRLAKHGYLLVLLPPLLVLALAHILFESTSGLAMSDFAHTIKTLALGNRAGGETVVLEEARARYIWLTTALLNLVVPLYALIVGTIIIRRSHSGSRLALVTGLGIVLASIGLIGQVVSMETQDALYRLVYGFTFMTLKASGRFANEFLSNVESIVSIINVLAAIIPAIIIMAFSSTLAPPPSGRPEDLDHLAAHMRNLRSTLNAASALLVAGVLHMNAWLQWPASLMGDPALQHAVSGTALAITIFWGATFTLMLMTTYSPVATTLGAQARRLLKQEQQKGSIQDPQLWLKDHDLSITLGEQLPQIAIMLAPILAGPLGSLVMGTN